MLLLRGSFVAGLALLVSACQLFGPKPAWELPPPPPPDAPVVQPGALHRVTLENGLEIIVLEDHRLPRVSLGVTARRGAGQVDPERAGLSTLTAELMKRGAGDRDALALAEAVDEIGARLGVWSDWDASGVSVSGLARDFDRLMEVLSDVVLRPRFDPAEAERALAEQIASLERAKDDPATLVRWYPARALYEGHRYGLPRAGTRESLSPLGAEDARALHRLVFVPNDCILAVSGAVVAEDFIARAREVFGDWPRGPVAEPTPEPPSPTPPARRVVIVDRPDLVQARIVLAHDGLARTDPRRIAASLMNDVFGGSGFSSRLTARLRAEAGLTYGVWSGFSMRRQPGPWGISTFTRAAETRRAIDLLLEEIERLRSEAPISEDELARAKSLAVGSFGLSLETSGAVLSSLVDLSVHGLPDDSLDTYRRRVRAVTVRDVAKAARELLHPDRIGIIVLGPATELAPALEGLGPVEVIAP